MVSNDSLAPQYAIRVAGQPVRPELARFIQSVEYESVDGIADMAKIRLDNPNFIFTDSKLWQAGNEIQIFLGYGETSYVGRVQTVRPVYDYPEGNAMPTVEVIGYTRDHLMMDNAPAESPKPKPWPDARIKDILDEKASAYGFETDIDDFTLGRSITQKAGLSDYDLVKGLANLTGYVFWVDADESGKWTLHFRKPDERTGLVPEVQEKKFTFRYNFGDSSTLLSFRPEYAIRDVKTKIRVQVRNPDTGRTTEEEIEDDAEAPDLKSTGSPTEETQDTQTTGGAVKLFFGEFSIETISNKPFKSAKEARDWALQWFRRNRENFVTGSGKTIGVETLFARQSHRLEGLGKTLDGDYYFTRVRHIADRSRGYECEIFARKVL